MKFLTHCSSQHNRVHIKEYQGENLNLIYYTSCCVHCFMYFYKITVDLSPIMGVTDEPVLGFECCLHFVLTKMDLDS